MAASLCLLGLLTLVGGKVVSVGTPLSPSTAAVILKFLVLCSFACDWIDLCERYNFGAKGDKLIDLICGDGGLAFGNLQYEVTCRC